MDENARKRRIATDRGRLAATALGIDYDLAAVPRGIQSSGGPSQWTPSRPTLGEEDVLNLLIDILHLADAHRLPNLDLTNIAKQAMDIHAQEKVQKPDAAATAPQYQG
jgi:hypothetical protein